MAQGGEEVPWPRGTSSYWDLGGISGLSSHGCQLYHQHHLRGPEQSALDCPRDNWVG